ncbi:hypothetical protein GA0061098_103929 [Bradyrhizobium shewense]|uniref:Uncharacterized protein n=1 Tax=Bradyrhizobium shewense TaxID=1761772 RepID=A0A1C3XSX7_9BRAD|nr:hypothetical protein GA0061098_103929 [Bradyrhizobium shewense]
MPAPGEVRDSDMRLMTATGTFAGSFLTLPKGYRLRPHQADHIANYRLDAGFGIAASASDRSD